MAENKDIKKDVVEEKKSEKNDLIMSPRELKAIDDFNVVARDNMAEANDYEQLGPAYMVEDGAQIFDTKVRLQHSSDVDRKTGRVWHNYFVAFSVMVGGKQIRQEMELIPDGKNEIVYDTLQAIVEIQEVTYLQIVRTPVYDMASNRITGYRYSSRVTCKTDDGVEFVCNLRSKNRAATAVFNNLLNQLRKREEII